MRVKNLHPLTHTRLPGYVRGHAGTVTAVHGCHVFPESDARELDEDPRWLYTVCFDGSELWGVEADPRVTVSADAFEPISSRRRDHRARRSRRRAGHPVRLRRAGIPGAVAGTGIRDGACAARTQRVHVVRVGGRPRRQIKRAQNRCDPATGETYYRYLLAALESLVIS